MKVAIVKYNAGNLQSVMFALNRLGIEPIVTDDKELLLSADKVIFPGVGQASSAIDHLRAKGLDKVLTALKQPFLGICLGLQLMCRHSEEGDVDCLGIFPVDVKVFPPEDKVPHMGWNALQGLKGELFKGIDEGGYVYFVHSYYAGLSEYTVAKTEYILPFSAALQKDNFYAAQFHPEKSGKEGETIIKNFLEL
ncbi:imidazole glycerol phosphate synthase subunit HisH [Cytophagaceae bacterium ABcell3]|nr:imidazole glycerol phosphate synthase subunit HisH [Cytophagaceae bacterium ABcell3]